MFNYSSHHTWHLAGWVWGQQIPIIDHHPNTAAILITLIWDYAFLNSTGLLLTKYAYDCSVSLFSPPPWTSAQVFLPLSFPHPHSFALNIRLDGGFWRTQNLAHSFVTFWVVWTKELRNGIFKCFQHANRQNFLSFPSVKVETNKKMISVDGSLRSLIKYTICIPCINIKLLLYMLFDDLVA